MKTLFLLIVILALSSTIHADEECHDTAPHWCRLHKMSCHVKWKELFKQYCKKTCGFCHPIPTEPLLTLPPGQTNPPYTGKCGLPEVKGARVIAGTTPPRGAWPWQILLIYSGFPNCGGTLIAPNWVVTAAHCVYRRSAGNFVVRVGEHDRTKVEGSEVEFKVAKVLRHSNYSSRMLNNDIALLKLSQPAKLNKFVQPACLPTQDPAVGSKCYITGWGKTHHPGQMTTVLQQGLLPVVSNKACYEKNKHRINIPVTDAMICGGSGGTDRISGCHGDSGGPFVCDIGGKWELHGSVSYGSPVCKSTETYTVFSRTMYFKNWIKNMMATQ